MKNMLKLIHILISLLLINKYFPFNQKSVNILAAVDKNPKAFFCFINQHYVNADKSYHRMRG